MNRKLFLFIFLILFVFTIFSAPNPQLVMQLFNLLNQRFTLMKDCAAFKYKNNDPVEITIPEREAMTQLIDYAYDIGLDGNTVQPLLVAEIMISKMVQLQWINFWHQNGFPENYSVQNYYDVLLPKQVQIDEKIMDTIKSLIPTVGNNPDEIVFMNAAQQQLTASYLTQDEKMLLVKLMLQVKMRQ